MSSHSSSLREVWMRFLQPSSSLKFFVFISLVTYCLFFFLVSILIFLHAVSHLAPILTPLSVPCVANEQKTWQLLLGLMWKNKSHVMPVWIYFSFWMASADVWGILDFLSASIAQLAPLGEVLVLGDVAVVSLDFDLRTFLPWMGIVLTLLTQPSPHPTISGSVLLPFLLLPFHASTLRGFWFQSSSQHLSLLGRFTQISGVSDVFSIFSVCAKALEMQSHNKYCVDY